VCCRNGSSWGQEPRGRGPNDFLARGMAKFEATSLGHSLVVRYACLSKKTTITKFASDSQNRERKLLVYERSRSKFKVTTITLKIFRPLQLAFSYGFKSSSRLTLIQIYRYWLPKVLLMSNTFDKIQDSWYFDNRFVNFLSRHYNVMIY